NLVLNQRVSQVSPLIPKSVWERNKREPLEEAFRKARVRVGLDLSARHDLTALVYVAEHEGEHHVRAEFFAPLEGLAERALRDRVPYDLWVQQGHIVATPGASVSYEAVASRLCELCDDYDVE